MNQLFNRRQDEYWSDPCSTFDDVVDIFLESGDVGFFLDTPEEVCVERRQTLPLLMLQSIPASVASVAPAEDSGVFVVSRLESHEVAVGRGFDWKPTAEPNEPYDGPAYDGNTIEAFDFDIRERVAGFAWREGTLAIRFVHLDRASEPVSVRMVRTPEGPVDSEVEAYVAANKSQGYPRSVVPAHDSDALLGYRLYPYLPAPTDAGLALAVDAPEVKLSDEEWVLRGAFRLPLLPREVVRPAEGGEADRLAELGGAGWEDVGDEHAVGVVPVTILVTGPGCLDPGIIPLQVPVYSAQAGDLSGQLMEGHFNINLQALPDIPKHGEDLYFYAISGAHISEACPMKIVGE